MLATQLQYILFAGIIVISLTVIHSFELPFLQACTFEDEKCHAEQVTKFFEMYGNGIEELNITDLHHLNVDDVIIDATGNENFNLKLLMENVELFKFPDLKCIGVKGFSKDVDKPMHLTLKTFTPQFILKSHCRANGKLLLFKVIGETDTEIEMRNVTTIAKLNVTTYKKDDKIYLKAEDMKLTLKIGSLKTSFSNSTLFNGEKIIMDTFVEVINQNWEEFRDEVEPHIKNTVYKVSLELLNKILATIPYDKFFKNSE